MLVDTHMHGISMYKYVCVVIRVYAIERFYNYTYLIDTHTHISTIPDTVVYTHSHTNACKYTYIAVCMVA